MGQCTGSSTQYLEQPLHTRVDLDNGTSPLSVDSLLQLISVLIVYRACHTYLSEERLVRELNDAGLSVAYSSTQQVVVLINKDSGSDERKKSKKASQAKVTAPAPMKATSPQAKPQQARSPSPSGKKKKKKRK